MRSRDGREIRSFLSVEDRAAEMRKVIVWILIGRPFSRDPHLHLDLHLPPS